jgi:putative membrane protein|tara:strand:- start:912 stop:1334 length:423 start_codon:yes stop_codon:yes gene_type:complete
MGFASGAVEAYLAGLPYLLSHFVVAIIILLVGVVIQLKVTPINENKLIQSGNIAASISLAGAFLALSIPLAASLTVSISLVSILIWGVTAIIIQLICDRLATIYVSNVYEKIDNGEIAPAIYLVGIKLSVAAINSAVISS